MSGQFQHGLPLTVQGASGSKPRSFHAATVCWRTPSRSPISSMPTGSHLCSGSWCGMTADARWVVTGGATRYPLRWVDPRTVAGLWARISTFSPPTSPPLTVCVTQRAVSSSTGTGLSCSAPRWADRSSSPKAFCRAGGSRPGCRTAWTLRAASGRCASRRVAGVRTR